MGIGQKDYRDGAREVGMSQKGIWGEGQGNIGMGCRDGAKECMVMG